MGENIAIRDAYGAALKSKFWNLSLLRFLEK